LALLMKRINLTTVLGGFAVLFGAFWLFGCSLMPLFDFFFREEKEIGDVAFLFIMLPMMAIPGILTAYYGSRLLREKSKKNIKHTVGAFAFFGALFLGSWVGSFFGGPEKFTGQISLLFGSLCAIPCYLLVSKKLILGEGLVPTKGEFVGRRLIGLLTFQVWFVLTSLIDEFAPVEPGYSYVKETPWEFVGFFGPFLGAWVFYKLAMRFVARFVADSQVAEASSPVRSLFPLRSRRRDS